MTDVARGGRRQEILDAAAELFAERGFHGVGVDDIGRAVGISGPGLYRHFPSKDAVLAEMLVAISEELLREGAARADAAANPRAALDALVAWQSSFALTHPALIVVQDRDLGSVPEPERHRIRQVQRRYVEVWVRVLCAVDPTRGEPEARAAAHAVFGLLNSTPHSATGLPVEEMAPLLRRMAVAALT
ncbi:MAG: TetR/AcrR family transcriptional regulator [Geodermatophilaceae bacterium]|nr:TetR/AcrR family transcriptional regulator [Geodermatophilaceae bacterium]